MEVLLVSQVEHRQGVVLVLDQQAGITLRETLSTSQIEGLAHNLDSHILILIRKTLPGDMLASKIRKKLQRDSNDRIFSQQWQSARVASQRTI